MTSSAKQELTSEADFAGDFLHGSNSVKISLASPDDLRSWSFGEVKLPATLDKRTFLPERDGLFCERIFGPQKDWECACGKYRGVKYQGMICDRCGVKITHSRVRRQRMGHIELAAPVVHIWFFRAHPSRLGSLLGMPTTSLQRCIYYQDYVVLDPKETQLKKLQLLSESEYRDAKRNLGEAAFDVGIGAEAIRAALSSLDLVALAKELRKDLLNSKDKHDQKNLKNRLKIVESIRDSDNRPEWMVLDMIPVIPPDLRPIVLLDSGNFTVSDLNQLYQRVIECNDRVRALQASSAPSAILHDELRELQKAVDALFDNTHLDNPHQKRPEGTRDRPLKSLKSLIAGKQGRFREDLLGKRVDFSARSVIVADPRLRLHQCSLPRKIALELFQPFVIRRLKDKGYASTIKLAKLMLERPSLLVWDALEYVIQNHPVLIHHGPTVRRVDLQAFEPKLNESSAIGLHPIICNAIDADFDGAEVAVHLPLSVEAQVEAHTLMMSTHNVFASSNGRPVFRPPPDALLGCYYATCEPANDDTPELTFSGAAEVERAMAQGIVSLRSRIRLRLPLGQQARSLSDETTGEKIVQTTPGRVRFNSLLPSGMDFYNSPMGNQDLTRVLGDCQQRSGRRAMLNVLERVTQMGFAEATRSGLSIGLDDLVAPEHNFLHLMSRTRSRLAVDAIPDMETKSRQTGRQNSALLMARSGAIDLQQLGQLVGIGASIRLSRDLGTIARLTGSSLRDDFYLFDYFAAARRARREQTHRVLDAATISDLIGKLVTVVGNVVVNQDDCGTTRGIAKERSYRGRIAEASLANSIVGRVSQMSVSHPITGATILGRGDLITLEMAYQVEQMGLPRAQVRSPLTCEARGGICRKCYGLDMSSGSMVEQGTAVGIIAAQAFGELQAQLSEHPILVGEGLPQMQKTLEPLPTQKAAVLATTSGTVTVGDIGDSGKRQVFLQDYFGNEHEYWVPADKRILVHSGDQVTAGQALTDGAPSPNDILRISGETAAQQFLIRRAQSIYRGHGIDINDKHFELIFGRFFGNVRIDQPGDTDLLPGSLISNLDFRETRDRLSRSWTISDPGDSQLATGSIVSSRELEQTNTDLSFRGGKPAQGRSTQLPTARVQLLGMTQTAAQTESFLSAASFRDTSRVLTQAALAGRSDELSGLQENVILGHLIPAGTGFPALQKTEAQPSGDVIWPSHLTDEQALPLIDFGLGYNWSGLATPPFKSFDPYPGGRTPGAPQETLWTPEHATKTSLESTRSSRPSTSDAKTSRTRSESAKQPAVLIEEHADAVAPLRRHQRYHLRLAMIDIRQRVTDDGASWTIDDVPKDGLNTRWEIFSDTVEFLEAEGIHIAGPNHPKPTPYRLPCMATFDLLIHRESEEDFQTVPVVAREVGPLIVTIHISALRRLANGHSWLEQLRQFEIILEAIDGAKER